jgi:hypothetical protein
VLGTSIQDAFQLQLTQFPIVNDVVTDAVIDGVGAARQLDGTAHTHGNCFPTHQTTNLGGLPMDVDELLPPPPSPPPREILSAGVQFCGVIASDPGG